LLAQNTVIGSNSLKNRLILKNCDTIKTNSVVWSSEGARVISKDFSVLQHPAIQTATVNGNFVNRFDLPANLNMQKRRKRPLNGVLEGITFNKNYTTLYTTLKNPCMKTTARLLNKGGLIRLYL
jgi:hypothetical protein